MSRCSSMAARCSLRGPSPTGQITIPHNRHPLLLPVRPTPPTLPYPDRGEQSPSMPTPMEILPWLPQPNLPLSPAHVLMEMAINGKHPIHRCHGTSRKTHPTV